MKYLSPYKTILFLVVFITASFAYFYFSLDTVGQEKTKVASVQEEVYGYNKIKEKVSLKETFFYKDVYNSAIANLANVDEKSNIDSIIIPHHLVASDIIAEQIKRASGREIKKVVLIGPNHNNIGGRSINTLALDWETPFGDLRYDEKLVNTFLDDFQALSSKEIFENEHSIGGITPFIRDILGDVEFMPISVSSYASLEEISILGDWLDKNLGPDALLIYSIDFSHYLSKAKADQNDQITKDYILSRDIGNIVMLNNDFVDAPFILALALQRAEKKSLETVIKENRNSFEYATKKPTETTSYFTISFKYQDVFGLNKKTEKFRMLFFGDLMIDRYVLDQVKKNSLDYLLENLDYFSFEKYDLVGANLEGAITEEGEHYSPQLKYDFAFSPKNIEIVKNLGFNYFTLSNNHISDQGDRGINETREALDKLNIQYSGCRDGVIEECSLKSFKNEKMNISMASFSEVYKKLDDEKIKEMLLAAEKKSDLTVVNIHWGNEYSTTQNKRQKQLARLMIDSGADIIIGHHPHVVQGMEIYKNKPIFYSLGNFVFDQYFSEETQKELAVDLEYSKEKMVVKIIPMRSVYSKIEILEEKEKKIFLSEIFKNSNLEDKHKRSFIKKGEVIIDL